MKSLLLFVTAALTLAGAMVVIDVPDAVEAAAKHQWCYTSASVHCGFDSKGECKKADAEDQTPTVRPCNKVPLA